MATAQQSYERLLGRLREVALLRSCSSLLNWDEETYMPTAGTAHRSEQQALLAGVAHEKFTDPAVGEWLAAVEASELVAERDWDEAVNVHETRREYDRATKVPKTLVEDMARTTTLAQSAWKEARKKSDFTGFQPWLEKVIVLRRQQASCIGYADVAYDALIDEYEPGATTVSLKEILLPLGNDLAPLVQAITSSGKSPKRELLTQEYPIAAQKEFGREAAAAIGFDFHAGRLDDSTHPFASGIGPGDTRLTARYHLNDFADGFMSILHEAGHGIYDQGLPAEHFGTPRGNAVSYGIHESQSRMWENFVGRSRSFWQHFLPKAAAHFPTALRDATVDDFYFAMNDVQRSFIRVEADEATYNLHVLLRFELEQDLISGQLPVADVPEAWNDTFRRYFGMTPPDDARGCLQDIHWSMGAFGYFPSYSLGNLYAAQFFAQAQSDLGDLDEQFARGDFTPLREWLREAIHTHGQRYRAAELVQRITGRPLSHRPLVDHLTSRFGPLYDL